MIQTATLRKKRFLEERRLQCKLKTEALRHAGTLVRAVLKKHSGMKIKKNSQRNAFV